LSFSVNFDPSILTQLSFYFDFSLFDLADSFYLETLGGVVEFESPNLIDRGFVLHIGNCLDFTRKGGSPPTAASSVSSPPYLPSYSSIVPVSEASLNPPAYFPPTALPSPSTSLAPVVVAPSTSSASTSLVIPRSLPPTFIALTPIGRYPSNPTFFFPIGDFPFNDVTYIRSSVLPFVTVHSVLDCPRIVLWEGNFYSNIPKYIPVEGGPLHSILPVVGRGPYNYTSSLYDWRLYPYMPNVFMKDIRLSDIAVDLPAHILFISNTFSSFSLNSMAITTIARSLADFYPLFWSSSSIIYLPNPSFPNQLLTVLDTQRIILPLINSIVDHVARCGEREQKEIEILQLVEIKSFLLRNYSQDAQSRAAINKFNFDLYNIFKSQHPRCSFTTTISWSSLLDYIRSSPVNSDLSLFLRFISR
jgi:hypothetical protein